jgi:hypothetical protein
MILYSRVLSSEGNKPMELTTVTIIQSMLAPGIMISACALLLLGVGNRFSAVVNRIRLLDDEKRRILAVALSETIRDDERSRLSSIRNQTRKLQFRLRMVRNAVFSYTAAMGFFIVASLSIGLQFFSRGNNAALWAFFFFLAGKLSVLAGIIYAAVEIFRGYQIANDEIVETEAQLTVFDGEQSA